MNVSNLFNIGDLKLTVFVSPIQDGTLWGLLTYEQEVLKNLTT